MDGQSHPKGMDRGYLGLAFGDNAVPQQAARNRFLTSPHHLLPHLVRMPFLIKKCDRLFPAHRAALFDGESHEMRKCDFGHHSAPILFVRHEIYPIRASTPDSTPYSCLVHCTLIQLLVLILRFCDAESANLVPQSGTL
jgi:hypothetical protein